MLKRHNIFPTRVSLFSSTVGKIDSVWRIQNKVFQIIISLLMTVKKYYMLIYNSFQRTGYFVFLRYFPFITVLCKKSTSQQLLFI